MKLEWDFSEVYKFVDKLKDNYPLDSAMMTATQNIAKVLHQHLLDLTPVDTGNLRKMWSAGENLLFTVERVSRGFRVTLVNKARNGSVGGFMYGLAVNDGHKTPSGDGWVEGRFFVEDSMDLTIPKLEQIVAKELQKWWDSV